MNFFLCFFLEAFPFNEFIVFFGAHMNAPGLETVPLLEESQTSSATKKRNFWKVGIAAVVSGGIGMAILIGALTPTLSKKSAGTSFVEATVGEIKFTAWNSEYASSKSEKNYPFLNDANVPLVEPHRATTLSFVSPARKLKSCSSTIVLLAGGGAWETWQTWPAQSSGAHATVDSTPLTVQLDTIVLTWYPGAHLWLHSVACVSSYPPV